MVRQQRAGADDGSTRCSIRVEANSTSRSWRGSTSSGGSGKGYSRSAPPCSGRHLGGARHQRRAQGRRGASRKAGGRRGRRQGRGFVSRFGSGWVCLHGERSSAPPCSMHVPSRRPPADVQRSHPPLADMPFGRKSRVRQYNKPPTTVRCSRHPVPSPLRCPHVPPSSPPTRSRSTPSPPPPPRQTEA